MFTRRLRPTVLLDQLATIGIRILRLAHRLSGCKETTFTSLRLLVRQNITHREESHTTVDPRRVAAVVALGGLEAVRGKQERRPVADTLDPARSHGATRRDRSRQYFWHWRMRGL